MARFVINEWLWHDSAGDNGKASQAIALEFIKRIAVSDHQIVIVEGTEFDRKAWALCKSPNTNVVEIASSYVLKVRQDLNRCLILKPAENEVFPEQLMASVKPDDRYLVTAQLRVPESILVSTDAPLRAAVQAHGLHALDRHEFLSSFFDLD